MTNASAGKIPVLLYGLLYGVISIALSVLLYLGGVELWLSNVSYLLYVPPIAFAFYIAARIKKQQGGYLELAESLKPVFRVLVLGLLIYSIFDYVLLNIIDKPFNDALQQATQREMEKALVKKGMPQNKIDDYMAGIESAQKYLLAVYTLTFALRCIVHFIIALIVSAIMKRKRPVFENSFNQ